MDYNSNSFDGLSTGGECQVSSVTTNCHQICTFTISKYVLYHLQTSSISVRVLMELCYHWTD